VIKAKGLLNNSLTLSDFINLYEGNNIKGVKRSAVTTLSKGSVIIHEEPIMVNHDAYKKRVKVFDSYDR
jgi:hypothetical protein